MRENKEEFKNAQGGSSFFKILNTVLVILVIISLIILGIRYNIIPIDLWPDDNGPGPKPNDNDDGILKTQSIIPSRNAGIINGHEHIQDFGQGTKWIAAMDRAGVSTTVMVGSPDATFFLNAEGPFNKYDDNNEELLKLVDEYPDRFIAFPTIYTYDEKKLEKLKNYTERGALGLKLFTGHFAVFYNTTGPLNTPFMDPVYEYCEDARIPIIWHVHLGEDFLRAEFEEVLERFLNLIINVPHFMLSSINLWLTEGKGDECRLRYYLEKYPNLYTDISFGYWAKDGLWRISNHTQVFREFLIEFQDRFTFGTDMVCTAHPRKDVEWVANLTIGYRDIMEKEYFNLTVTPDIEGDYNGEAPGTHSGLNLPKNVLDKIYYDNMVKFLNCRPYYEDLDQVIKNSKLKYQTSNSTRNNLNDLEKTEAESEEKEIVFLIGYGELLIICSSLLLIIIPALSLNDKKYRIIGV